MSPAAATPAAVPSPPPPAEAKDFPDWLSPMIVKELRQGMRTAVFLGSFIALQAVLVMLLAVSASAGNSTGSTVLFWGLLAFILVFIVPLRGFNALAGEAKAHTLDMLALTRLTAWRIAVGKWAALVLQGLLIAVSVMPYVVLRYYGGGVNVFDELRLLALLLLLSTLVCALAVCFSALPSVILRTLLVLATWWFAGAACIFVSFKTFDRFYGSSEEMFGWVFFAFALPLWAYLTYFVLDLGATCIAPVAANHATRKRLISLGVIGLGMVVHAFAPDRDAQEAALVLACCVLGVMALDCLTEAPTEAPSVYVPFVRRGALGRLAAWFFAPGWATGLLAYGLGVALVMPGVWAEFRDEVRHGGAPTTLFVTGLACAFLSPLVPLLYALLLKTTERTLLPRYVAGLVIVGVFSAFMLFFVEVSDEDALAMVGGITPLSALIVTADIHRDAEMILPWTLGTISGVIILLCILVKARTVFRGMRRAMREAAAVANAPATATT